MPNSLKIEIGQKFTAKNFEYILSRYWDDSLSPKFHHVSFDLRDLEWIALEEITFLFAWFRQLIFVGKRIKILLPDYYGDYKKHNSLKNLWGKWKIYSFYYDLIPQPDILENYFSVSDQINKIINDQVKKHQYNQENIDDDITVVPFQHISAFGYGNVRSIDDLIINKIHKPLNLSKQVFEVLQKHTKISEKDNLLLSKIVTNELFLNVLHHSFQTNDEVLEECYFAISLKRKLSLENVIKSENSRRIFERQQLLNESYDEAEKRIEAATENESLRKLDFYLNTVLPNGYENERSFETLDFFKEKRSSKYRYKNETYIEFTFLDFGKGIPSSLRDFYLLDINNPVKKEIVFADLNSAHFLQNEDTRILEYAFMMNSSRHPFDLEIQMEYEIPRGLYYLIDIVRRHSGLVIARSRRGKIIFDFSEKEKPIKDSIRYVEDDHVLPDLHGTMISIIIPATQDFQKLRGPTQPPYTIPEQILNRELHYYALIDFVNQIENETGGNNISLQDLYKSLFDKLTQVFYSHREKPALLIFDFSGLNIFPLKHKLLFFFASSPNVNRQTSVVVLNFFDIDIIDDVKNSINYKLRNNQNANYIYKPVPIINSDKEIYWLSVPYDEDEKLLTELLQYEDHHLAQTDLHDFENYKGLFFDVDRFGNVTANTPMKDKILELTKKHGKY